MRAHTHTHEHTANWAHTIITDVVLYCLLLHYVIIFHGIEII